MAQLVRRELWKHWEELQLYNFEPICLSILLQYHSTALKCYTVQWEIIILLVLLECYDSI